MNGLPIDIVHHTNSLTYSLPLLLQIIITGSMVAGRWLSTVVEVTSNFNKICQLLNSA